MSALAAVLALGFLCAGRGAAAQDLQRGTLTDGLAEELDQSPPPSSSSAACECACRAVDVATGQTVSAEDLLSQKAQLACSTWYGAKRNHEPQVHHRFFLPR